MPACVLFGVEIHDRARYQDPMSQMKPALRAVGTRYLARGAARKVCHGECGPAMLVSSDA
jgi:uncharacterized protein (DUF1330 family)